jgi:phosphopantetheinyl transferase (holo-ACP synthase)
MLGNGFVRVYDAAYSAIQTATGRKARRVKFCRVEPGIQLGHVFAASGFREACAKTLSKKVPTMFDWALIEVRKERMGNNLVCFRAQGVSQQLMMITMTA